MLFRLRNLVLLPFRLVLARIFPVAYARMSGVRMSGAVTIFGSAYRMFSTEPFLVTLGDNVFISLDVKFICHDGSTLPFRREHPELELMEPISVGSNVFIGTGALILKGVQIGNDCIVGANSVVTKNVPDGVVVAGNPARIVKSTDEWLKKALERSAGTGALRGRKKLQALKRIYANSV